MENHQIDLIVIDFHYDKNKCVCKVWSWGPGGIDGGDGLLWL